MCIKTDFYKHMRRIYYITSDPLDDRFLYTMVIVKNHRDISYGNMTRLKKSAMYSKTLLSSGIPCGIGWVPTSYDVLKEHPELFI